MVIENLTAFFFIYVACCALALFVLVKFKKRLWTLFCSVLFPLILISQFTYNVISSPSLDLFTIFPYNQGRLERLPSNELIDLLDHGTAQSRTVWICPLIELYYQGRTLLIPDDVLDSLDISRELLQTLGQLAEVVPVDLDRKLTENEVEMILDLEGDKILMNDGNLYHFVTGGVDQKSPLLLLKYENQLFFIPGDLLSDWESSL